IIASEYVGALAGYSENATITNVHITNAEIDSDYGYAGGLIGTVELEGTGGYFMLEGVGVDGGAIASLHGSNVGGLIGKVYVETGSMLAHKVFADIDIINEADDSGADTGGLFGELEVYSFDNYASQITVADAYAWGEVYVPNGENIGGLIGKLSAEAWDEDAIATITIQNTYAMGNVTASNEGGGLVGQLSSTEGSDGDVNYTISNSFAMGMVDIANDTYTGGLVGRNETTESERTFANNYYDQLRTDQAVCATDDNDGEPLTCTAVNVHGDQLGYFINNNINAPMDAWNFNGIWVANYNIPPTFKQLSDADNDGILDEIENAGPNNGDANNDGILDGQQSNVASFVNSINEQYVAVALDNQNCRLIGTSVNSEDNNTIKDAGFNYTTGLVNFAADCGEFGATSTVNIYQYGIIKDGLTLRKYNPNTLAYFSIDESSVTDLIIDQKMVVVASYRVTDGGVLDVDGEVNGQVIDPVGLASLVVGSPNTGLGG
ncbi:hypothetical protein KDA11_03320, partial [Candidatus Saccharibacteria bacterium]|nr:hypothetical protein [Candidatus Saccharibacteria bacterium]